MFHNYLQFHRKIPSRIKSLNGSLTIFIVGYLFNISTWSDHRNRVERSAVLTWDTRTLVWIHVFGIHVYGQRCIVWQQHDLFDGHGSWCTRRYYRCLISFQVTGQSESSVIFLFFTLAYLIYKTGWLINLYNNSQGISSYKNYFW